MGGGRLSSQGPADPERGFPGGSGVVVVEPEPRVGRSREERVCMSVIDRREAIQIIAVAPLAVAFRWAPESVREAAALAREALARGTLYEPKNFNAHEWETVRLLVDIILPQDERSGSATDAGVPEFMDFMLGADPDLQAFVAVRDADVLGVWSPNRTRADEAAAMARRLDVGQARAFPSIAAMVADPAIEAIWLCGPNHARVTNVEEITDAVTRGKAGLKGVACEKPLARNVAEAKRVLELTTR